MAKARQIASSGNTVDLQAWFAEVLRLRFAEVLAHRESALDPQSSKGIHDMRVAIRRLRSVIRDFAKIVEGYPLKKIRMDLKRLADALGEVRDADVAAETLDRLADRTRKSSVRDGIALIAASFREKRGRGFERLWPRLSDKPIETLKERFELAIQSSLGQRSLFDTADLDSAIRKIIENRVVDFLELSDAFYDPFRVRRLHRLRIATKHLRYAVELLEVEVDGERSALAGSIAKMQTYLGDCHDCDVWIDLLRTRLKTKTRKTVKGPEREASVWLLSQFVRMRNKAYRAALALWSDWEKTKFLSRLKEWTPAGAVEENKEPDTESLSN
jgi:CHAD domain-containing protein